MTMTTKMNATQKAAMQKRVAEREGKHAYAVCRMLGFGSADPDTLAADLYANFGDWSHEPVVRTFGTKDDSFTYLPTIKHMGIGFTVSPDGSGRLALLVTDDEMKQSALPLSVKGVADLVESLSTYLRLGSTFADGSLISYEDKQAAKKALGAVVDAHFDIDGERADIAVRALKFARQEDMARVMATEKAAREKAEDEVLGIVRRLAMAASMPDGAEKAGLLDECAPMIKKAFQS